MLGFRLCSFGGGQLLAQCFLGNGGNFYADRRFPRVSIAFQLRNGFGVLHSHCAELLGEARTGLLGVSLCLLCLRDLKLRRLVGGAGRFFADTCLARGRILLRLFEVGLGLSVGLRPLAGMLRRAGGPFPRSAARAREPRCGR